MFFCSLTDKIAEKFPLLPRIRRSFWGLLLFCILFITIGISNNDGITLAVKPVEYSRYANQGVTSYHAGAVTLGGYFTISNPGLFDKIFLPESTSGLDLFTLLFMAIGSGIIIWMVPKLQQQNLFRKDISNAIGLLGYLLMLHGIISIYRMVSYAPHEIESLTRNEFTTQKTFPIMLWAELYFSLVVIALAHIYQRGMKLQEEQDLTV
jgi:hypothetical protein